MASTVAGVAIVSGIGGFLALKGIRVNDVKRAASVEVVKSEEVGMTVERDASLEQSTYEKDEEPKQLWRFTQPVDSRQQFVVSSYYEQGATLRKLASLTKMSLKDAVLDNVSRQLPQQYPGYKKINENNLEVNGAQATEIVFQYVSQDIPVRQRLLLLFKDSDTVVYIRGQTKATEYNAVNGRYFDPVFSSVRFDE